MTKGTWITIIVIALILIGGFFIWKNVDSNSTDNSGAQPGTISQGNTGSEAETGQILSGNTTDTGAKAYEVSISGMKFSPQNLKIHVGDTVKWTNLDSAGHTITSDVGGELISQRLYKNGVFEHRFTTTGTYDYHCSIHSGMLGTVVVE